MRCYERLSHTPDVIQLELKGEHLRSNISDILQGDTYFYNPTGR